MREAHTLLRLIEYGQEGNVAQVGATRTAEVQMTEADNHRVAIVIA